MLTPQALADTGRKITTREVEENAPIIAEFLDYLRWLADQDTSMKVTTGDLWELFHEGVRLARFWSEVCEGIGLPLREEWE